jgi:lipopolysaccharide biosynthesis glycosyltransferase
MKYCFATYLTSNFAIGYEVMVTSLLENNSWFDAPFFVFHRDLTDSDKAACLKAYSKTVFRDVDADRYEQYDRSKIKLNFAKCLYKLDLYTLAGWDRVFFMDVDMIVLRDISGLLKMTGEAVAAWRKKGHFNIGLVSLDGRSFGVTLRDKLIEMSLNMKQPDQQVFNEYFKGRITRLPDQYNIKDYAKFVKKHPKSKAKIVHFQHTKPWHRTHLKKQAPWKYWWRYYGLYRNKCK